jgi:hypothetical protein
MTSLWLGHVKIDVTSRETLSESRTNVLKVRATIKFCQNLEFGWKSARTIKHGQRYIEITLLFNVAQGIFLLSSESLSRSSLYLKEREEGSTHSCTLQSCDCYILHRTLSVDSDKIPEGGTTTVLIFSISLGAGKKLYWEGAELYWSVGIRSRKLDYERYQG